MFFTKRLLFLLILYFNLNHDSYLLKMKFSYIFLIVLFSGYIGYAQNDSIISVDDHYKEDQFYIGATYNLLTKDPSELSQTGFSSGIHFGFIKDMPLNKTRNVAIGIGLGYSLNSFNQNLLINKNDDGSPTYSILDDTSIYIKNKFSTQLVELPVEFRWRTSTSEEYKFWRVYTGFKVGYLLTSTTKFKDDVQDFKHRNINDFNKLQYGLSLSAGYNTWNLYVYYGLNPIFSKEALIDGSEVGTQTIKVGLMFYIL